MEILDSTNSGQSFLTDNLIAYIKETAKWAKFLAIVGFVLCGFMVILAFSVGAIFSNLPNSSYPVGMASGMITFIYIVFAILYFVPTLFLFQFATNTLKAIVDSNMAQLEMGMGKLKSVFKYWGIFTIIILSFYGIMILFALLGGLFASSIR